MKILFLNIISDNPETIQKFDTEVFQGPYSELFRKKLGIGKDELVSIDAAFQELPDPAQFNGVILGGSVHNPIPGEEKPWMENVYACVRKAVNGAVPLLGVCGGHQFVDRALGGEVIYNPEGRKFGTIKIKLTGKGEQDPLFRGVPDKPEVQLGHQCIVKQIKPVWQLLASSESSEIQAVAINERTRIVQFHPELDARHMQAMTRLNKTSFLNSGFVKDEWDFERFLSSLKETPAGGKVLRNFLTNFVLPSIRG